MHINKTHISLLIHIQIHSFIVFFFVCLLSRLLLLLYIVVVRITVPVTATTNNIKFFLFPKYFCLQSCFFRYNTEFTCALLLQIYHHPTGTYTFTHSFTYTHEHIIVTVILIHTYHTLIK